MKIICAFAATSLLMWGQDGPKIERKLIQLKYVEASRARNLAGLMAGGGMNYESDDRLHFIAVRGPAESVAIFEEAVKKLDVPPTNFELTVYLISTAAQGGDQLPEALGSTAKQLHEVFAYKSYQLLESFVLRAGDGQRANTSGSIAKDGKNSQYTFSYERCSVSGEAPKMVNLHNLRLEVRYYTGVFDKVGNPLFHETGMTTDVDARDGQKVVVGKSDLNYGSSPLILVVTAKVVQ
jgi:hypothetical protein